MTQATHTPAPWDWQDGFLIGDLDGAGGDVSFAEIGNTRLIAAAPDLLAALTEAYSYMVDYKKCENNGLLKDMEAAIAKAREFPDK